MKRDVLQIKALAFRWDGREATARKHLGHHWRLAGLKSAPSLSYWRGAPYNKEQCGHAEVGDWVVTLPDGINVTFTDEDYRKALRTMEVPE